MELPIQGVLIECSFLRRPNRFTAVVEVGGREVACHLRDPGRLEELLIPRTAVLIRHTREGRKTRCEVVAVEKGGNLVFVNSGLHQPIVSWLLQEGLIGELRGCQVLKKEWKYGDSRIDFLLSRDEGRKVLLEVKGCTLVREGVALFPDAPTERGRKHVEELRRSLEEGYEACVLFLVTRGDARSFAPNESTDPEFSEALKQAVAAGVKALAYSVSFDGRSIHPVRQLQVQL